MSDKGGGDSNVPKLAERNYQREQRHKESQQGWMLEALDSGPVSTLTEDDRSMQLERDRIERLKQLSQEKKEKAELLAFLSEQKTVKAETLVIGKAKGATMSVLGDVVDEQAEPKTKKSKVQPNVVVVVKKDDNVEQGKPKQKATGGLSMLGAYK
jgi:hypothetical protein